MSTKFQVISLSIMSVGLLLIVGIIILAGCKVPILIDEAETLTSTAPTASETIIEVYEVLKVEEMVESIELEEPIEESSVDDVLEAQIDYDAEILARLLTREADVKVVKSETERACVLWTVLNRVDKNGTSVEIEVTKPHQFAWDPGAPIREANLKLAYSVLRYWYNEKETGNSEGRVLPANYYYFYGDGKHNHFYRMWHNKTDPWDYSLPSPYET